MLQERTKMKYIPDSDSYSWGLSYKIHHLVTKMRLSTLQAFRAAGCKELSLEQYELLVVLFQNNGSYQRQLSKLMLKDRPNITKMLKNLEKEKLVLRKATPENKRIKKVYITELGKQVVYKAAAIKNIKGKDFLGIFNENELDTLENLIEKMTTNLDKQYTIST